MSSILINAIQRQPGRKNAKAARREGLVPGVYYAKNQDPVHFSIPTLTLRPVVYTAEAKMVRLDVGNGQTLDCVLKDVTFDPITDAILHIDFQGVAVGERITVEIPLHLVGSAEGAKFGGLIEHTMHKLHVKVDPHDMPEHIDVDITPLKVGQSLHVSDLDLPGMEVLDRVDAVIVACVAPKGAAAEAAGEAAEGTATA